MNECYKCAIKLLGKRDYSRYKMREKLLERKFSDQTINEVLQELEQKKYINEELYLEGRVRHYARKDKGPRYIIQKCSDENLAITEQLIQDTYQELGVSEEDLIMKHIKFKLRSSSIDASNLDDHGRFKVYAKLQRYLMTKGFKVENIEFYINRGELS